MLKVIQLLSILIVPFYLLGCASGSYELTGNKRPAIKPEQVTIFSHKPDFTYERLGKVKASSEKGFSDAGRLEKAKEELKDQAAKIGANGIILDSISEGSFQSLGTGLGLSLGTGGLGASIGSGFSLPKAKVSGEAIFYSEPVEKSQELVQ
ncbi:MULTISPECIES: hypothetical protein [Marinomonas]|uniref:hypothetical protein n=1 Tax=Marinomonas TaxID=28253 RepID=UPI001056D13A|nr:hypothetical protein [Marinomonas flavescens]